MTEDHTQEPGEPTQPQPMCKRPAWHAALRSAGVLFAGAGALFAIVSASLPRLSGATRSAKLKFDRRQREVDQAVQKEDGISLKKAADNAASDSETASR